MPTPSLRLFRFPIPLVAIGALVLVLIASMPARADSWALLIGINDYEDSNTISSLGGADNDANALAKALIESAGFPQGHVAVLTSSSTDASRKPSRHNILHELEVLRSHVGPGDTVFISYSGHGVDCGGAAYLLPYDADIATPDLIRDSSIAEDKFREYLRNVPAKALVMVFDMCRTSADKSGKAGAVEDAHLSAEQVRGLDFTKIVKPGSAAASAPHPRIVAEFFACAPNFRSYEWKAKERGYFSYFLEEGLRGRAASSTGDISLDALKRYLATVVPAAVRENELGKDQTPAGNVIGPLDAGDYVIAHVTGTPLAAVDVVGVPIDTAAHLTVRVDAHNAVILVDGMPVTPGQEAAIDLGLDKKRLVEIGVSAQGYQPVRQNVLLVAGAHSSLPVKLAAVKTSQPPRPGGAHGSESRARVLLKVNPKDGADLVYIPAGQFFLGDDDLADNKRHTVTLSGYFIYKNLVTVAMYRSFCHATGRTMPDAPAWGWQDRHPMTRVTWDDAKDYCEWAGARLPTEAQWEEAARGDEGRKYPWGETWDLTKLRASTEKFADVGSTAPVGSYPLGASPYGVLDMAGNLWQWCEDSYDKDFWTSSEAGKVDPVNENSLDIRILRGGSWYFVDPNYFRTAFRGSNSPTIRYDSSGFRAVVIPPR